MTFMEFIEHSSQATSPFELFNRLVKAASPLGFEYIAYASLEGVGRSSGRETPLLGVMLNFPSAWEQQYRDNEYHRIDPVFQFAHLAGTPFYWDDLPRLMVLTPEQKKMMAEAAAAGLVHGVSVPLYGPRGGVALISFAAGKLLPSSGTCLGVLNALAGQFHLAYMRFAPAEEVQDPCPQITRRERECLRWIARGKSSADIAAILGISENTVNFHIKKLLAKLDVHSRTVAVLRAQTMGLLD